MSLYVNDAADQPNSIYYKGNSLNTVYYNGNLVWKKVKPLDYTNWEDIIKVVEKKASGEITEWPEELYAGEVVSGEPYDYASFDIPLNGTSEYWGSSVKAYINLYKGKENEDTLLCHIVGPSTLFYYNDKSKLYDYKGYTNSIPREKCLELYNLLPTVLKSKLKPHIIELPTINVDTVIDRGDDEYYMTYEQTGLSADEDYVFLCDEDSGLVNPKTLRVESSYNNDSYFTEGYWVLQDMRYEPPGGDVQYPDRYRNFWDDNSYWVVNGIGGKVYLTSARVAAFFEIESPITIPDLDGVLEIVSKKANGEITKWPASIKYMASNDIPITVPLTKSTGFWGKTVDLYITKEIDLDTLNYLPLYAVSGSQIAYFDPFNLENNYLGYTNSIPRAKCQELANALPFKDRLIAKTSYNATIDWSKDNVVGTGYGGVQYLGRIEPGEKSVDTDYVFLADYFERYPETVEVAKAEGYEYTEDYFGIPSNDVIQSHWPQNGGNWLYETYGEPQKFDYLYHTTYWLRTNDIYPNTDGLFGFNARTPGYGAAVDDPLYFGDFSNNQVISSREAAFCLGVVGFMKIGA